jgi:hypothetical protein
MVEVKARSSIAVLVLCLSASVGLADDSGWTVIDQKRGITMSKRVQPGCALPSFRGQGRIEGNVLQLLAVMLDLDRVASWAHGVSDSRVLSRIDARAHMIYLHSDLPWPVRDRDMVVRSKVEVLRPQEEFRVTLECKPSAEEERSGTIRIKRCYSTFHLRKVDARTTEVDYTMTLDPGGHLPSWSTELITKSTPFKTLVALEERAAASMGEYAAAVRSWSAAM